MQIKVLDRDFYKSASYLRCPQELNAQIYEAIHGLASLLECIDDLELSDKCKNKIKRYKDYPQCRLWKGYEKELLEYIRCHLLAWNSKYEMGISYKNYIILFRNIFFDSLEFHGYLKNFKVPDWITDEFIQMHRSVLIQKEIEREKKDKYKIMPQSIEWYNKHYRHYRNLWPDCSKDLKMQYDWR